tara:strand:- start:17258 stop:17527 length:270 start_codon:yes stop_codon:yes gene_type:complete
MNLYMVHVGYYDPSVGEGLYEIHMNFFTAAKDSKEAKENILKQKEFKDRKMHIDGIKELSYVDGYKVSLNKSAEDKEQEILDYDDSKKL